MRRSAADARATWAAAEVALRGQSRDHDTTGCHYWERRGLLETPVCAVSLTCAEEACHWGASWRHTLSAPWTWSTREQPSASGHPSHYR